MLLDAGDQSFVDVLHDPAEQLGIDMFGESVAGVGGLQTWEGLNVCLCCRLQLPVAQPVRHVLVGNAHKVAKRRQVDIVGLQREKEVLSQSRGGSQKASNTLIHGVCDGAVMENTDP